MKWLTYDAGQGQRVGVLDGDVVKGLRSGVTLVDLIQGGADELAAAGADALRNPEESRELADVRLLAPIPQPPSMRDGLCFMQHLRNCRRALGWSTELDPAWSEGPGFYFTNPHAVVGPYDDVPVSPGSTMFDLELEVGAVIGRRGRDVHPDRAEDHIIGYTLYNDWTARDHQVRDLALGLGMGKSKDSATTLGPYLVTVDELEPYRQDGELTMEFAATVNDVELTRGTLAMMDWKFGELLSYISRGVDLVPGDVIGSGTMPRGCLFEHVDTPTMAGFGRWLKPGDVVSLAGEGMGETRQTVVEGVGIAPLTPHAAEVVAHA